jgi:ubiquinone/menaquinone biosynthesis C-methylase UbiE
MSSCPASPLEIRRLIRQAAVVRPITERLLRSAGIGTGMRVLDAGCGAGDVSFLAAELIGPCGSVVGIDRRSGAVAIARERARKLGLNNVSFRNVGLDAFDEPASFDAVIGRYVLIHHAEPEKFLRTAVRLVRPGGIVAVHEGQCAALVKPVPFVRVWNAVGETLLAAYREVFPNNNAAAAIINLFSEAGQPLHGLFCEVPICGPEDSPFCFVETLTHTRPPTVEIGSTREVRSHTQTLEYGQRATITKPKPQLECQAQICAWTRMRTLRGRRQGRPFGALQARFTRKNGDVTDRTEFMKDATRRSR